MKIENIPANIKSKSLKEAKDEINQILEKLESKNLDLDNTQDDYIRLIQLNKHIENLFKKKSRDILNTK
jgi:exonuclease VII small subunit